MATLPTIRLKVPGKQRIIKVNAHDFAIHQFGKYAGWLLVGEAGGAASDRQVGFEKKQAEIELMRRNSAKSPASGDPKRQFERHQIHTPVGGGNATLGDAAGEPVPGTPPPTGTPAPVADPEVDRSGEFDQSGGDEGGPAADADTGVPLDWKAWRSETKWLAAVGTIKKVCGVKPVNKDHAELLMAPYEKGDRTPGEPWPADQVPANPRPKGGKSGGAA